MRLHDCIWRGSLCLCAEGMHFMTSGIVHGGEASRFQ